MPLVSVVMPVFNCEAYVEEAVASVLGQTERDLELITVNDGSTDRTPAILQSLARQDARLKVHTQPNSGKASIARNKGVALASGDLIAFNDGDDVFHPRRLERGRRVLERFPDTGLVFSDLVAFATEDEKRGTGHLAAFGLLDVAAKHFTAAGERVYRCDAAFYNCLSTRAFGVVTPQTVMVRRAILAAEPVWFPEDLATYEDNDLWLRLALRTRFAYIDETLAYYRRHTGNITSNEEKMALGAIVAKTRNLERGRSVFTAEEIRYCRQALSKHYFSLGYLQARSDRKAAARMSYLRSARLRPTGKALLAYLKTLLPAAMLDAARKTVGR